LAGAALARMAKRALVAVSACVAGKSFPESDPTRPKGNIDCPTAKYKGLEGSVEFHHPGEKRP